MKEVLYNIYLLFYHCNPDSAYGIDRAKEYNESEEIYNEKIRYFTKKYANIWKFKKHDRNKDWDFNI